MKEKLRLNFRVVAIVGLSLVCVILLYMWENNSSKSTIDNLRDTPVYVDTIPDTLFMDKLAHEGIKEALDFYDIQYPEIVYAQAILETGYFKSDICLSHNNLFGLYNSKKKEYYKFNHWSESVVAYKDWIQRKYKPPENYYYFLKRVKYAEDPEYTNKLKQIVNRNDKRTSIGGGKDYP